VACWSTKAAIYLKRVKIEEKLLWKAYRNLPTLFRTVPTPTPYGLLFPNIGGSQPPKLRSLLSQKRVKLRTSNFVRTLGALKMLDVKMTDVKLTDQFAGHEIAGRENAGMKQQDTQVHTSGERLRQNRLSIDLAFHFTPWPWRHFWSVIFTSCIFSPPRTFIGSIVLCVY